MSGMAIKFTSLAQIGANQFVSADDGLYLQKAEDFGGVPRRQGSSPCRASSAGGCRRRNGLRQRSVRVAHQWDQEAAARESRASELALASRQAEACLDPVTDPAAALAGGLAARSACRPNEPANISFRRVKRMASPAGLAAGPRDR
jgi:hypothetical protein